jgi:DNA-binding transcriptional LysR family regulator/transcription elongation GreA/GreB family factor
MTFFARVVEARSFSEAARALGVSKSAVSTRVTRLEERFGVRLLHRTTRKIALTADGVRFYERCARVLLEADQAAEVAAGASAVPRGTLRVYAPAGFGEGYLAAPIREFMHANPGVRIELRLSDHVPDLAVHEFDVALVVAGRLADSGLTTRKLVTARIVVCAAPDYLRRKGIPFRPQDLAHHDCVSHSIRQTLEDWRFHTDEGSVSIASLSNLVVDSAPFLREAALKGLGIVMLPEFVVADDLAAGRLHRVLDGYQEIELAIHILHPHDRLPPASVRTFIEHLTSWFRRPPWEGALRSVRSLVPRPDPLPEDGKASDGTSLPMTEQDVRRLTAVAALYADIEAEGSRRLVDVLARARVVPPTDIPRESITMFSRVQMSDPEGIEHEVSLAYPWDAEGDQISVLGDFGLALLGATVGSRVSDGARTSTITAVPYQAQAAGEHDL